MAEQGTHKPLVGGSNPPLATELTFSMDRVEICCRAAVALDGGFEIE